MTPKENLEIAAAYREEEEADHSTATANDPFNLAALKINMAFKEEANVRKILNVLPVRRPKKQEWIRVHPDVAYRGDFAVIKLEADGEYFLVAPAVAREFAKECSYVSIYTGINTNGSVFLSQTWSVVMTYKIDDYTLTGVVRAEVSFARDKGETVEAELAVVLAVADLLELPDDTLFVPAVCAAMGTKARLDDPTSIAFTRKVAVAAGYGKN